MAKSVGSIDVGAVIDPEYVDSSLVVIDAEEDAIRTASGTVQTLEFAPQRLADSSGKLGKISVQELDYRRHDAWRHPLKVSAGACS